MGDKTRQYVLIKIVFSLSMELIEIFRKVCTYRMQVSSEQDQRSYGYEYKDRQ